ncbi:MAG: glycine cleavage system protein GcvH [Candidatus Kapabacteria bacterium]|nr:glycine cleavage system protein GcvH [Candidatus Kapabacteria bacterium]MDW8011869.1 glycine cleavage system protein GcvH [Bacteroidota bacterium]
MRFPEELWYTKDHEWLRVVDGVGTVGVTDHAQRELGDIVFVDVTVNVGQVVEAGQVVATIEAVKTVADVYSPVRGKVLETNSLLSEKPELINQDPYGEGWILRLQLEEPQQLDQLLDAAAYKALIGYEE